MTFNRLEPRAVASRTETAVATYGNTLMRLRASALTTRAQATSRVADLESKLRSLDSILAYQRQRLDTLVASLGETPTATTVPDLPSVVPESWLTGGTGGVWRLPPDQAAAFDADNQAAYLALREASGKTFGGGLRRRAATHIGRYVSRLGALDAVRAGLVSECQRAQASLDAAMADARRHATDELARARKLAEAELAAAPLAEQPWSSSVWQDWNARTPNLATLVRLGTLAPLDDPELGPAHDLCADLRVPLLAPARGNFGFFVDSASRERGAALARSVVLRRLATTPPGHLRLHFFDPVSLGHSASSLLGLSEYDPALIGGKVWSRADDLEELLARLTDHMELVVQKYLRDQYVDIDAFNDAAGEIGEPWQMLVLFDAPRAWTERSAQLLKGMIENGPRCGISTLLVVDESATPEHGVRLGDLGLARHATNVRLGEPVTQTDHGYTARLTFLPETDQGGEAATLARSIVETVGRRSLERGDAPVTLAKTFSLFGQLAERGVRRDVPSAAARIRLDEAATWWQADSIHSLAAPIGQKGATDVAALVFDSSEHAGALLVGRPGSGKSTLMHSYIAGLCTMYSPAELELYLIDFKEGVEFKAYGEAALPHARVVAVESDREFGLDVLASLVHEIGRRGAALRETGGRYSGLEGLRAATHEAMPRVLLVFDEFQVLFSRADEVGREAARLLEVVIRQGRGFGVHVLLGSQSLAGMEALGSHVPTLLPTRILLASSDEDAIAVLGERNDGGRYLSGKGAGVLNQSGGAPEANEWFVGSLLEEGERMDRIVALRAKADREGFIRRPEVFEGNVRPRLDDLDPRVFREEMSTSSGAVALRLRAGRPTSASGRGDLQLRREQGAHVLVVVRNEGDEGRLIQDLDGPAYGLLLGTLASALQSEAHIDLVSFMPADDGLNVVLEPLLATGRITSWRRQQVAELVDGLRGEADRRLDDGANAPSRLLIIFGLHRVRDLDSGYGGAGDPLLAENLTALLRDGPDVGIHVWSWCDSNSGLERRLQSSQIREFSWRIVGQQSRDDSLALLGNDHAEGVRPGQVLIANAESSTEDKCLAYLRPGATWLGQISQPSM